MAKRITKQASAKPKKVARKTPAKKSTGVQSAKKSVTKHAEVQPVVSNVAEQQTAHAPAQAPKRQKKVAAPKKAAVAKKVKKATPAKKKAAAPKKTKKVTHRKKAAAAPKKPVKKATKGVKKAAPKKH